MSRIAKQPISLPSGVEVKVEGQIVTVKGARGQLEHTLHSDVSIASDGSKQLVVTVNEDSPKAWAQAGTARAVVSNLVTGVSAGFERKLQLVGVGYRAQSQGKVLNLTLGFSHPVSFNVPEGITIDTPSQTEVLIKGIDKQLVGQVAAKIRAYRPPEPYKGKGVRYSDEVVVRKEAKKK